MTPKSCPLEERVATAARSGEWTAELETHRDGCPSCAELTLVVASLQADAEELVALEAPLPDPSAVWLRARLEARERDFRRATRGIAWVQRAAMGVVLAIALAFAPGLWAKIAGAFRSFDPGPLAIDLPRAAGSPLLVVVSSFVIVGLLAFWELAAASDS